MDGNLSYNSNSLQTYNRSTKVGINTNVIEHTDIPQAVAELMALADTDGSVIPDITYPSRSVKIGGTIHGSSQADLDSRIDTFKGYFRGKDKNLDITYAGSTRRYIATKNAVGVVRQQKQLWATFSVEFICTNPFGLDTSATALINQSNYTSATLTSTPTVGGTAPYQLPVITITIDALTGTGDYIQIANDLNTQEMVIYGLGFTAGDVLVIDCVNRTVKLNGTEVDYNGTFLVLEPGSSSITYTDGFTTRQVDILVEYIKRYL